MTPKDVKATIKVDVLPPGIEDLVGLTARQLEAMLARKMLAVMRRVERIEKDATNPHHRYQYASEQAIKEALHPIMAEEGVLFGLECSHDHPPLAFELGDGKAQLLVPLFYTFTDGDTGHQIMRPWYGTGHLRDDKGLYGALTGALKYALTTSLLIPTGDDPEADSQPVAGRPPVKGPQQPAQPPGGTRPAHAGQPGAPAARPAATPPGPPADSGLRCISCGHVAKVGDVKQSKAKFDGRKGQVMAGEPAYFCPGKPGGSTVECGLYQSVHGAGVNHVTMLKEETEAKAAGRSPQQNAGPAQALADQAAHQEADRLAKADEDQGEPVICAECGTTNGHVPNCPNALPF